MASVEEEYDIIDEGEIHRIMQEGIQEDDATSQIIVEAETDCIENTAVNAILCLCDITKPILLDQWSKESFAAQFVLTIKCFTRFLMDSNTTFQWHIGSESLMIFCKMQSEFHGHQFVKRPWGI